MSPLNRKLLRDLWRVKGQAVAIGLVIALGVLMGSVFIAMAIIIHAAIT